MENKGTISFGPGDVQVFEVTMDNDEDQEELNRLLRKPGEPPYCPPTKSVDAGASPPNGTGQPATEPHRG